MNIEVYIEAWKYSKMVSRQPYSKLAQLSTSILGFRACFSPIITCKCVVESFWNRSCLSFEVLFEFPGSLQIN